MASPVSPVAPANGEPEPTVFLKALLGETAIWTGEEFRGTYDLERVLKLNTAISYRQNNTPSAISIIVSQDNAFIASLSIDEEGSDITIIVYRTEANSLDEEWTSTAVFTESQNGYRREREKPSLMGWISCDGRRMMIEYRPDYSDSRRIITSDQGRTWAPFRMTGARYDSHGDTSIDDNHMFFLRDGGGFGGGGQGQIVDVYSTTTWSRVRSWTFAFGDGQNLRNVRILPNLAVDKPVHLAISTSRDYRTVIASSHGLQFQVATIDHSTSGERTWISDDGRHMVYLSRDDGKLHFWDLTNPTYEPLKTIQLPDVETSGSITLMVNGRPLTSGRAIPRQSFCCRFSPGNEVVTVIVANDQSVVVLSFLTFNLQLVYKRVEPFGICPGHQVLQVRIGDARGISLVGSTPVSGGNDGMRGLVVTFSILTGAYEDIRAVENHFDTADATLKSIGRNPPTEKLRILRRWTISPDAVTRQLGDTRALTADEREHQLTLFNSIFLKDRFATYAPNTAIIQERVFHLMTITYPWDPKSKVYVFAVRMKYEYSIVAMAVAKQVTTEPYLIRVLSVSENLYASDPETVEIIQNGPHYVLKVQGKADGSYSGIPLPSKRVTIIGHHFMPNDAPYDMFIIKESTSTTMPSGGITSPNVSLVFTANFAAYFPPKYIGSGGVLDYGHRNRASYVMPKLKVWLGYAHRSRRNEPFFGGGELMDQLGEHSTMVFDDPVYDDKHPLFPSGFATAATLDILSNKTLLVDEFMKRYHTSDALIISNSHAISCSLPSVCRARPLGVLSLMRHIALFNFKLAENTAVIVSNRAHERNYRFRYPRNKFLAFFWELFSLFKAIFIPPPRKKMQKANTTAVTIPLDGFCTYDRHIYDLPVSYGGFDNEASEHFYNMAEWAYYDEVVTGETRGRNGFSRVRNPSRPGRSIRTSPFTCLVEEIFRIDDQELQFSIIKVIWFEKLVFWKLKTFGQYVFLTRIVLPSLANWVLLFTLSILTSRGDTSIAILVLGGIQAFICAYLIAQKFRQARATRLFFRSFYNYMDVAAIGLSITNAVLVLTRHTLPRPFVAYATAIVWVDVILSARAYEKAGVLMILLTEMMKGVMPFLILLALFIVGFTFIPFLLLKDEPSGPFINYGRSLGEMITFMSNDFNSLDPFKDSLVSIQVLRAVFTVLVSILFLNSLIALLNLRVEAADKRSRNIWIRQMSAMIVEIERGILTASERRNQLWFPRWFTYNIREDEKNQWQSYVDKHPLKLGYAPDNNPNPTVVVPRTQGATISESSSQDPSPTTTPAPQTQPMNYTVTVSTEGRSTTATVPGSVTIKTPAKPPPVTQPTSTMDPSSSETPSVSPASATNAATSTPSAVTQPTVPSKVPSQPSSSPAKLPTPSGTATTPLATTTPTLTSQPPAESTTKSQPSTSIAVASTSRGNFPPAASHIGGGANAKEEMVSQKCQICELVGTKLCTGCRRARYCSAEHQRQDWAAHKKVCAAKGDLHDLSTV